MIRLNGIPVEPTIFSDKTSQIWQLPKNVCLEDAKEFHVVWDFESESEVMHLCQLVDLIKYGQTPRRTTLLMPYLPYARQDKEISNETTFALRTFAWIINSLGFDRVATMDAHSSLGYEIINNFESANLKNAIKFAISQIDDPMLAFPDKGAFDRYSKLFQNKETILGHKVRDQKTGYITYYEFEGYPKDRNVLMIDDLCDGGMTFKILAEGLLKAGAKSVSLYVSHGLFSKGQQTLYDSGIHKIYSREGLVNPDEKENPKVDPLMLETELSNL